MNFFYEDSQSISLDLLLLLLPAFLPAFLLSHFLTLFLQFTSIQLNHPFDTSLYVQEDMEVERPRNTGSEEDVLEWAEDGEFSPPMSLAEDRDKFLIFTTGSKTYSPHQIGM